MMIDPPSLALTPNQDDQLMANLLMPKSTPLEQQQQQPEFMLGPVPYAVFQQPITMPLNNPLSMMATPQQPPFIQSIMPMFNGQTQYGPSQQMVVPSPYPIMPNFMMNGHHARHHNHQTPEYMTTGAETTHKVPFNFMPRHFDRQSMTMMNMRKLIMDDDSSSSSFNRNGPIKQSPRQSPMMMMFMTPNNNDNKLIFKPQQMSIKGQFFGKKHTLTPKKNRTENDF